MLGVWNNHVVHRLFVVLWVQRAVLGNFPLGKPVDALGCLKHDIALVDLPETVAFRFHSDDQEVYWDVSSLGNFLVLLHETQN